MVRALPWMSVNGTTVMSSEFLRSLGRRFSGAERFSGRIGYRILPSRPLSACRH